MLKSLSEHDLAFKKLITHPLARREANEATAWYLDQSSQAATRFADELAHTMARIRAAPGRYPIIERDFRRALLDVFPYGVIHRETLHEIQILAIAHDSRRPGYWRKRKF